MRKMTLCKRERRKTKQGEAADKGMGKGPGVHTGSCRGPRNRRKAALPRLARRHLPQCSLQGRGWPSS